MHSFARPTEARVTHVALDLAADFKTHRLGGTAALTIHANPSAHEISSTPRDLTIESVTDSAGRSLTHDLGASRSNSRTRPPCNPSRGSPPHRRPLHDQPAGRRAAVADAGADRRRKQPYLFSQGQAILTRTWIPTQDSPGIRQTYEARIIVPAPLMAVMSAEALTPTACRCPTAGAASSSG